MIKRYLDSRQTGCRFCGSRHIGFCIGAPGTRASVFECGHMECWLVGYNEAESKVEYTLHWENSDMPVCASSINADDTI